MSLTRLIFYSRNKVQPGEVVINMIKGILKSCHEYSPTSGLTGGLVFNERHFLQVMEGDRTQISRQLKSLYLDERHSDLVVLSVEPIDWREFDGWAVAYAGRAPEAEQLYLRYGVTLEMDPQRLTAAAARRFVLEFTNLTGNFVQRAAMLSSKHEAAKPEAPRAENAAKHDAGVSERIKITNTVVNHPPAHAPAFGAILHPVKNGEEMAESHEH